MGRKPKYDEPTVTVGFKVPKSKVDAFKFFVNELLNSYTTKRTYNTSQRKKIVVHNNIVSVGKSCGCQILGKSTSGKEIWKYCKEHKTKTK